MGFCFKWCINTHVSFKGTLFFKHLRNSSLASYAFVLRINIAQVLHFFSSSKLTSTHLSSNYLKLMGFLTSILDRDHIISVIFWFFKSPVLQGISFVMLSWVEGLENFEFLPPSYNVQHNTPHVRQHYYSFTLWPWLLRY